MEYRAGAIEVFSRRIDEGRDRLDSYNVETFSVEHRNRGRVGAAPDNGYLLRPRQVYNRIQISKNLLDARPVIVPFLRTSHVDIERVLHKIWMALRQPPAAG